MSVIIVGERDAEVKVEAMSVSAVIVGERDAKVKVSRLHFV